MCKITNTEWPLLQRKNGNNYSLSGKLNYQTVPFLWQQSQGIFSELKCPIIFDLSEVIQSDSSGVALLLAWTRDFRRQSQTIQFIHLPNQMLAIIQLDGLTSILPIVHITKS